MAKHSKDEFKLLKDENLIKKGMINYCVMGGYSHAMMGDGYLTDRRFYFESDPGIYREKKTLEFAVSDIESVYKTGVPFFTRSIVVVARGKSYRFNVFPKGGWLKAFRQFL